ncbi:MAG: isoaspartyl peptidase/L-asparaginase family protein [Chthoniobacterales bacterium]
MKTSAARLLLPLTLSLAAASAQETTGTATAAPDSNQNHTMQTNGTKPALVIHGGAGTIDRSKMTPEKEKAHREGLENALRIGWDILQRGGSALDATETAVRSLEDNPLFNAGRGAVFTSAGTNEMDASTMEGKTMRAGAVANVQHVKNPILLARKLLDKAERPPGSDPRSGPVLMVGEGAEAFAKQNGIELVDAKYFFTQERWDSLQRVKQKEQTEGGHGETRHVISDYDRHGTVGAVALDRDGNLAASTSTGGMTNKTPGRLGDSPIIGAGTYAKNATCAVSCTGDGEYFIRAAVANTVSDLIEFRGMSLQQAAEEALKRAHDLGGEGGLIAIDKNGNHALPFNSSGMYRGYIDSDGKAVVDIYK